MTVKMVVNGQPVDVSYPPEFQKLVDLVADVVGQNDPGEVEVGDDPLPPLHFKVKVDVEFDTF